MVKVVGDTFFFKDNQHNLFGNITILEKIEKKVFYKVRYIDKLNSEINEIRYYPEEVFERTFGGALKNRKTRKNRKSNK